MSQALAEYPQFVPATTVDITAICTAIQVLPGKATDGLTQDVFHAIFPETVNLTNAEIKQKLGILIADCRQMALFIILDLLLLETSLQPHEASPTLKELQVLHQVGRQHENELEEKLEPIFGYIALRAFVTVINEGSATHS